MTQARQTEIQKEIDVIGSQLVTMKAQFIKNHDELTGKFYSLAREVLEIIEGVDDGE